MMEKKSERLLSLDVMRGMTIAGMILVNNPGTWGNIYAPLRHAEWNGLTPTDLVFPFFMFIMGVSTYFSLKKYNFIANFDSLYKIIKRTVLIFLIGWAVIWFGRTWSGLNNGKTLVEALNIFDSLRYLGVFPRLAICYGVTAILALLFSVRAMKWIAAIILIGYTVILFIGNGFIFDETNILAVVDRTILGEAHMYTDTIGDVSLKFDPEGLLSTLPSIAHCIIGFVCGAMIVEVKDNWVRAFNLFVIGTILTMAGFLLAYGCPINKKIWSPTFVLTTCGLACSLFALLIWIIDLRSHNKWCTFFKVFGVNPLFLYVMSTILAMSIARISIVHNLGEPVKISLHSLTYKNFLLPLCSNDAELASLCFAVLFVLLNWCIGYILYRYKIYIKI